MEAPNDLLFVTVTRPDEIKNKSTQRAIRRRVMREIGQSRRKPKKTPAITFSGQQRQVSTTHLIRPALESVPLPIELDDRARQLVHFMQSEADYKYRPFRDVWFKLALHDSSAFTLSMANAAMFLDEACHPATFQYERSGEALAYYGRSVSQVTSRLADPVDCVSEGLMTTVLGLICHDLYVGTMDRWAYHILGLKRMIEIRGGLYGLNANLQLFASWFDVMGSVAKDSPPRLVEYSSFSKPLVAHESKRDSLTRILGDIDSQVKGSESLSLAIEQVEAVCTFVNTHFHRPEFWQQEQDLTPLTMLGPPTYTLVSMPRYESLDTNSFCFAHEMVRVALLILLAGLKEKYELAAPEMGLLQDKLESLILNSHTQEQQNFFLPHLQNWALVTAAMLRQPHRGISVYTDAISRRMHANNFTNGFAVLEDARNILWIDCLQNPKSIQNIITDINAMHQLQS